MLILSRKAADAALYITIIDGSILLLEFQNFADVFSEKGVASFSTNISVTYTIKLIEKVEISYDLIYLLSEKELKILKEYFKKIFIKR
jgi:hypothetical protein